MSEEENLSRKLHKLEITAGMERIQTLDNNQPLAQNPNNDKKTTGDQPLRSRRYSSNLNRRRVTRNRRKCSNQCCSPAFLNQIEQIIALEIPSSRVKHLPHTQSGGVQKPSITKLLPYTATSNFNRKLLLSESFQKAVQIFLQSQNQIHNKPLSSASNTNDQTNGGSNIGTNATNLPANHGSNNYQDLVEECCTMLAENVDFNERSNIAKRNSTNISTVRSQRSGPNAVGDHEEADAFSDNEETTDSDELSNSLDGNTCSWEAGNNSKIISDDVTIDELASYFDDYVHIPRKMSTMAEMMYI